MQLGLRGNFFCECTIAICPNIREKAMEPHPRQSPFPLNQAAPGKQLQSSAEAVAFWFVDRPLGHSRHASLRSRENRRRTRTRDGRFCAPAFDRTTIGRPTYWLSKSMQLDERHAVGQMIVRIWPGPKRREKLLSIQDIASFSGNTRIRTLSSCMAAVHVV